MITALHRAAAPMPATAVVLQLAQEGKLRLSGTVERWLPGLLPYGNRITIEQLMTDSSGLLGIAGRLVKRSRRSRNDRSASGYGCP